MKFKKVILTITVPSGKYCSNGGETVCEHHDVQGYGTGCNIGMGRPKDDAKGWQLKPEQCLQLVNV